MAAEVIGRCTCPVCGSAKASLRLSAKQLSYVHCNTCHFQGFARSDHSDGKLRSLLIADDEPAAPIAAPPVATAAAPVLVPAAPVKQKAAWGIGSW